jgi:hypothetical protein
MIKTIYLLCAFSCQGRHFVEGTVVIATNWQECADSTHRGVVSPQYENASGKKRREERYGDFFELWLIIETISGAGDVAGAGLLNPKDAKKHSK